MLRTSWFFDGDALPPRRAAIFFILLLTFQFLMVLCQTTFAQGLASSPCYRAPFGSLQTPYVEWFSWGQSPWSTSRRQAQAESAADDPRTIRAASHQTELAPPLPAPNASRRASQSPVAAIPFPWSGEPGPLIRGRLPLADAWTPSHDRDWIDEQRLLPFAEFRGTQVTIHHVRNARFYSYRDCLVEWEDRTYDLRSVQSVDFLMVPFANNRAIAHTMLSFGFTDGEYLGVSVEVRLEKGETYNAAIGLMGQFELMYVLADERDLLPVRPKYRGVDVYLYPTTATPAQARALFVDILQRVNEIYRRPEFYDTLRNNCTTNIVRHINALAPGKVPYDYRVLLPGFADSLAYELGLLDRTLPLEELRRRARITDLILACEDDPHFSQRIRRLPVRTSRRP